VLALPFTTLREVELDASLALPDWKIHAIHSLGYGTNGKMMIGFNGRPWIDLGGVGESFSDLPNHQLTWETNPSKAGASRGVLTAYSSGSRGANLNPSDPQGEASRFLGDLDQVFPGALASAKRDVQGRFLVHLEHWPSNPLSKGSYTCYLPGQFTTIAGNEGKAVENVYFAGEHANSFTSRRDSWKARRCPASLRRARSYKRSRAGLSVNWCLRPVSFVRNKNTR
jgi:monoamine oxidase